MIKVLVMDCSPGFTGAFNSIFQTLNCLQSEQKLHCHFMVIEKSLSDHIRIHSSMDVSRFTFIGLSRRFISLIAFVPGLIANTVRALNLIRKGKIDILHVNDVYNLSGILVKIIRPKVKVVYHVRLLSDSYIAPIYGVYRMLVLKYSDLIFCVSKAAQKSFEDQKKTRILYDSMASKSKKALVKTKVSQLLYLANYAEGKGHDLAIHVFKDVHDLYPDIRMKMAGSTLKSERNRKYKRRMQELIQQLGLEGYVELQNFEEDTEGFFISGDIFLNFSQSESFSMTCLEALSLGVPVVATKSGGPQEIIEDGMSGYLVDLNHHEIVSTLDQLIKNYSIRKTFSQNGMQRVHEHFSLNVASSQIYGHYLELLSTSK